MQDKYLHTTISALLVIVLAKTMPIFMAVGLAFLVGIGKELYDKFVNRTRIDVWDLTADAVGLVIGGVIWTL